MHIYATAHFVSFMIGLCCHNRRKTEIIKMSQLTFEFSFEITLLLGKIQLSVCYDVEGFTASFLVQNTYNLDGWNYFECSFVFNKIDSLIKS